MKFLSPQDDLTLKTYVRIIGAVTLLAFAACWMPFGWMREIAGLASLSLADEPVTEYLARHLSLVYALLGALLWYLADDISRHRAMISKMGFAGALFGVCQGIIDLMSGMPWWWTWGESISTVVGAWWLGMIARPMERSAEDG